MSPRAAAALERLLAARVPEWFFEELAAALEAPSGPGGDETWIKICRNKGRLVDLLMAPMRSIPLTEERRGPHNPE